MHGENLRKFTETRARPPRGRDALIFPQPKIQYSNSLAGANRRYSWAHTWQVPGWRGRLRRNLLYSGGSSLGAKGLPPLLTLVLTGGTGAERGKVPWVFCPAFFIKLGGTGVC